MTDRILIIGGGLIGLGIGWQMAKAGREVLILEARKPGRGASWAAAGILSAQLQAGEPHEPLTRFQRHSRKLWPEFAAELHAATGHELGLRHDGVIVPALDDAESASLQRLSSLPRSAEHGFRWLTGTALQEQEPGLAADLEGGLLSRKDGQVDNRAVAKALRLAFEDAGGRLRAGVPALRIVIEGDRAVGVETEAGLERAGTVVLAAGAWSGGLAGLPDDLRPAVVPVAGQMIALAMDPDRPLLKHTVMAAGGYLVPRANGTLLVGATSEERGFDGRHTGRGLQWLLALAGRLLPAALDLPVEESWVGFRPGTPDHLPVIGPGRVEGLVFATGHGHNGVLMTPATVEALCVYLLTGERAPAFEAFGVERFGRVADHG